MEGVDTLPQSRFDTPEFSASRRKKDARRAFRTTALALLCYELIVNAALLLIEFIGSVLGVGNTEFYQQNSGSINLILFNVIPLYAVGFPLLMRLFRKNSKRPPLPQMRFGFGKFAGCFCIALVFAFAGSLIGQGLLSLYTALTGITVGSSLTATFTDVPLWLEFIIACICAPIVEELVYRKFVIDRVGRYGEGVAIVFSAVIFGLAHGNLEQMFYVALLGTLLGYIYVKTGKIVLSILLHAAFNFWGSIVSQFVTNAMNKIADLDPYAILSPEEYISSLIVLGYELFEVFAIIAGIILLVVLIVGKKIKLNSSPLPDITSGRAVRAAWLNLGTFLLLLFTLGNVALSLLP